MIKNKRKKNLDVKRYVDVQSMKTNFIANGLSQYLMQAPLPSARTGHIHVKQAQILSLAERTQTKKS